MLLAFPAQAFAAALAALPASLDLLGNIELLTSVSSDDEIHHALQIWTVPLYRAKRSWSVGAWQQPDTSVEWLTQSGGQVFWWTAAYSLLLADTWLPTSAAHRFSNTTSWARHIPPLTSPRPAP